MRLSVISLTYLSFLFTLVTALPVLEARQPTMGHVVRPTTPRTSTRNTVHKAPSNVAHKSSVHACARKHKREIEFQYIDRRDLPDHKLTYEIGTLYGSGGFGDVYQVIGHPELLAKLAHAKAKYDKQVSVEVFKEEAEHSKRVGQLVDWGYKMDDSCNKVYYIIMHKIPGTPFYKTAAYIATRGNPKARKVLVDKVVDMVADRIMHYLTNKMTWHADTNASNVMCVEDANHNIVSVELVDWGFALEVSSHTYTHELAKKQAEKALMGLYAANSTP